MLKISQHLAKLEAKNRLAPFSGHGVQPYSVLL